jgi:hypothetical protein
VSPFGLGLASLFDVNAIGCVLSLDRFDIPNCIGVATLGGDVGSVTLGPAPIGIDPVRTEKIREGEERPTTHLVPRGSISGPRRPRITM